MIPSLLIGWRKLGLALAFFLSGLASSSAGTGAVDISTLAQSLNLIDALTIRLDPGGRLAPQEAASLPGASPGSRGALRFGYTLDTIWLRFHVVNSSGTEQTRWLSVGDTRLEFVDAYQFDATGRFMQASWQGGNARSLASRPIPGKESLFPVRLAAGEEAVLVVRVHGRSMLAIEATLWDPVHYREREATADLRMLVPAGALLALSAYLLLSALQRRDLAFILLALWLVCMVVSQLALNGYLFRFLFTSGGEAVIRAPIMLLSLTMALCAAFVRQSLSIRRESAFSQFMLAACMAGFALALGSTVGDLRLLGMAFIACLTLLCLAYPFLLVSVLHRPSPLVGLLALALTGLWATVVARVMLTFQIVPLSDASENFLSISFAGTLACVALLGVAQHSISRESKTRRQQDDLLKRQQQEQMRLEAAIDARTRALQDAIFAAGEANRAKSDFLARVSHDLRAPLTAILGYADLIISSGGRQAENGHVIRRSAKHLLGLLNDLIDYARGGNRPEALQPLPVYAANLMRGIAAEGESLAARRNNHFVFEMACELPAVIEIDEKRLRQILINLLDNAAKFTHDGHIRFSVQCEADQDADNPVSVAFVVEDDGPGMLPTELERIFEPFARLQAAETHEGIGLGLAIAKQWVDCMGGHIEAQSVPGKGTRMCVTMTLKPTSEDALSYEHQTREEDRLREVEGAGQKIWVIEDSHEIRNLLCLELRSQGLVPLPIGNGQDALARIASPDVRAPDLVLTDLNMPFASGYDVLAGVRARWPDLPVVLVTATPDSAAPRSGHSSSARVHAGSSNSATPLADNPDALGKSSQTFSAIIAKPISLVQLRQVLADLLELSWAESRPGSEKTSVLDYPDASHLADARKLIGMGAISDLIEWADDFAAQNPAWSAFSAEVKVLAERGSLNQLQQLCEREEDRNTHIEAATG